MARRYLTDEELLARKLLGILAGFLVVLIYGGIVILLASAPPKPPQEAPGDVAEAPVKQPPVNVGAFKDRIARLRFVQLPLGDRKNQAQALLGRAPTKELRRAVETFIEELRREEYFEVLTAFEVKRRGVKELASKKQFGGAEKALAELATLAKGHEELEQSIERETRRLAAQRARAQQEIAAQTGTEVAIKPPDSPPPTEVPDKPPDVPPTVPPDAPPDKPPVAVADGSLFEGIVTVQAAGGSAITVQAADGGEKLTLGTGTARVLVDERIADEAVGDTVSQGSGLWLLGRRVNRTERHRAFGPTTVKAIEQVKFGFLAGNVAPDQTAEDKSAPGLKWHFGKVAMSFPILRVAIENEQYLILDQSVRLLKRAAAPTLPPLAAGRTLWVEGSKKDGAIEVERLLVLWDELSGDPAYRRSCEW